MSEEIKDNTLPEGTEEVAEVKAETAEEQQEAPKKTKTRKSKAKTEVEEKITDPVTRSAPPEIDWNAIGKKYEVYSGNERTKLEGIYNDTLKSITDHEVLDGTVVAKNNREVVVNIGFKSDGIIPLNELRYNPDLKIGDKIEVYVENQEDTTGQLILSHKKARVLRSWERINDAYEKQEIINGYVKCRTKGGLIVMFSESKLSSGFADRCETYPRLRYFC